VSAPSPEVQLVFLSKLQRLFAEGDFTATYKFALLIALPELAVELGQDKMTTKRLANAKYQRRKPTTWAVKEPS